MVNALINLNDKTNRILNIVKAINNFKDKGEAIEYVVEKYSKYENQAIYSNLLSKEEIISKLELNSEKLKKLGVKKLGLFGSYLRGEQKSNSDIDFLVVFKKNDLDSYVDTKEVLEKLFEKDIDLVFENSLKPGLIKVKDDAIYVKGL